MLPLLGSIIGAGASLIGGAMQSQSNREANEKNYEAQKEFAQQGLRWKVADAKAAGVHPLYAVGAPTQSFSPSFVGDSGIATGVSQAGQDIGRAVAATQTTAERAYNTQLQTLQLERASLENDLLRSQIARSTMAAVPAFPSVGGSGDIVGPGPDLMLGGDRFRTDKGTSPAEAYQTQYGDVVENLVGVPMAVGDLWHHLTKGIMPWLESNPHRQRAVEVMDKRDISPFPYDVYYNSPSAR